jgi:hypothetical protein
VCTISPPVASASPVFANAGAPFTLDGSTSQGTSLTFAWTTPAGAPVLDDPTAASPAGTATTCGTFDYSLIVTDGCGTPSSPQTVTVTLQPNGPYVSNETCDAALECGTIDKPFCTITAAIAGTASSPVKVHGTGVMPYAENVDMKDQIDVEGGWDQTFTTRDPSPATNGAEIDVTSHAGVTFGAGVNAKLSGFTVKVIAPSQSDRAGITMDGSAGVVLDGVRVRFDAGTVSTNADGVHVFSTGATAGSLSILGGSDIVAGDPSSGISTGIRVDVNAAPVITLDKVTVTGGTANYSVGIHHSGSGTLTITGGTIAGGVSGANTRGVFGDASGMITIQSGAVVTGGTLGTERIGVVALSTPISIDGSTITGSAGGGGKTAIGVAIQASAAAAPASITNNVAITGGQPGASGAVYEAYGVIVATPSAVTIGANTLIQGCAPAGCKGGTSGSYAAGVRLNTPGTGNTTGKIKIQGNKAIVGGPGAGVAKHAGVQSYAPIAIWMGVGMIAVDITQNEKIVGNEDPSLRPDDVSGINVGPMTGKITENKLIFGGHGGLFARGVVLPWTATAEPNTVTVTDNAASGGRATGTVGMSIANAAGGTVSRNVVQACGIDGNNGGPATDCTSTTRSIGLQVFEMKGALVSNNFAFGSFGTEATGCMVGGQTTGADVHFEYNLCLSQGKSGGSNISTGIDMTGDEGQAPAKHKIQNNILAPGNVAGKRYGARELAQKVALDVTFRNNVFQEEDTSIVVGVAAYLRISVSASTGVPAVTTELDTVAQVNALNSGTLVYANNVALAPVFAAPNPFAFTVAGYRPSNTCNLKGLGITVQELLDYDGKTRANPPSVGPIECP